MAPKTTAAASIAAIPVPCLTRFQRARIPALLLAISLSLLITAAFLTPDARGVATHTQLGLPSCSTLQTTGIPCATCGMTTAFAFAAHGHLIDAFITQPAGAMLALTAAMTVIVCTYALIFDLSLAPLGMILWRPKTGIWLCVFVLAAWLYKALVIQGII